MHKSKNVTVMFLSILLLMELVSNAMADNTSKYPHVLGTKLTHKEVAGSAVYDGAWTRRPGTDIFDAVWGSIKDVITIESVSGNKIVLKRQSNGGHYYGTLSADGSQITGGTASWFSPGWSWSATVIEKNPSTVVKNNPIPPVGMPDNTSKYPHVLGTKLTVKESAGSAVYNGTWTRRPGTDIFDAVWGSIKDVITIESVSGNKIVLKRQSNGGHYYGTLSADGSQITGGTASWFASGWSWSGTVVEKNPSNVVKKNPSPLVRGWQGPGTYQMACYYCERLFDWHMRFETEAEYWYEAINRANVKGETLDCGHRSVILVKVKE